MTASHSPAAATAGSFLEVLLAFGKLGLTSFGGPVAHWGYFRTEFVASRPWISDTDYADQVALCEFLPGPTSRQVGMALGLRRSGWASVPAAWLSCCGWPPSSTPAVRAQASTVSTRTATLLLALFTVLLLLLPLLSQTAQVPLLTLLSQFYRASPWCLAAAMWCCLCCTAP